MAFFFFVFFFLFYTKGGLMLKEMMGMWKTGTIRLSQPLQCVKVKDETHFK
jgi:hypothetical protein